MSFNAKIISLYWDNVPDEVVDAQRRVCDWVGVPVTQHRIDGFSHGEWIDWVLNRLDDVDVFLFLDIDAVPLSMKRLQENFLEAAEGTLVGAEGAANHIDPSRSYAGAWYTFVNRSAWKAMGRPTAQATPYADVAQNWTDTWRAHGRPVRLIEPTEVERPKWDLPGRPNAYGVGTRYGDDVYHLFESRFGGFDPFLRFCDGVLAGARTVA